MRGLYAIVDADALALRGVDPAAFTRAVAAVQPAAVQLRAKSLPSDQTLGLLRSLVPICRPLGVPLVVNDRPDLALLAGCSWVHVGQHDMDVAEVRRLGASLRVGVSTHSLAQLDAAIAVRPDYVAYGPVFDTSSKKAPDPVVGVAGLREAHVRAAAAGIPLVAIGGITRTRASEVRGAAEAIAVIADLMGPADGRPARRVIDEAPERALALSRAFSSA